jgi:nitrate/TMAO reductase-like tetraheme cytochrome c subunit
MRIGVAVFVLTCVAVIVVAGLAIDRATLSAEEIDGVEDSCGNCHRNPNRLKRDAVHRQHHNADCAECHIGVSGLETADKGVDAIEWAWIGIVALTVTSLGLNYAIARRKLKGCEKDRGKTDG